jgi:hypothetical protein
VINGSFSLSTPVGAGVGGGAAAGVAVDAGSTYAPAQAVVSSDAITNTTPITDTRDRISFILLSRI